MMEPKFKIKIISSSMPLSWYRDRIGETFEVLKTDNVNKRYIVHIGRVIESFVCFDDCKIVK